LPNGQRIPENVKARVAQANADISKHYHAALALKVKKHEEIKLHIPLMIAIIEDITPATIRAKINIIRIQAQNRGHGLRYLLREVMRMLYHNHGPQGDRTASEWEDKLQALDITKGVNTTFATYKEYVTNLQRVRRLDELGMPIESPDRAINSYCPSDERLKRFLLTALGKAPFGSPFRTMAVDMRLASNAGRTPEQIIALMEEYKDIGHDTIPMRRVPQQANDRRHLPGHPGNQVVRY
jgi:hypothetical protein